MSQLIEHPYNAGSMSIRLLEDTGIDHSFFKDIKKMNMWEPLIKLLQDPYPSIQRVTLAIFSSAIQNDESTRQDVCNTTPLPSLFAHNLLQFDQYNLLPQILDYLRPKETGGPAKAKAQAVSCLTQALKHNRASVEKLEQLDLWSVLATALGGTFITGSSMRCMTTNHPFSVSRFRA